MRKTLGILKPLLTIAVLVGGMRFILSIAHAPRAVVYLSSLTAVEMAGMLYLPFRIANERELGYLHLWTANMVLFGVCQSLTILGLAYTYLSHAPTLYHETERLRNFLGFDPPPIQHVGMHVLNWMIIAPAITTWIIGAPILYVARRRTAKTAGRS